MEKEKYWVNHGSEFLRLNFWGLSRSGVGWALGGGAAKWRRTGESRRDEQLVAAIWETRIPGTTGQCRGVGRAGQGQGRDHCHLVLFAPSELASSGKLFPSLPGTRVLMLLWSSDKLVS